MKYLIVFTIFFSLRSFSQSSSMEDSIMRIKGKWKSKAPFIGAYDPALSPSKFSIIHKKIDSIASFFIQAYPTPKGAEAEWHSSLQGLPLFKNGPSPYSFRSSYFLYYFNKSLRKIILGDETTTWAYVFVNSFNWFLDDAKLDAEIGGKKEHVWMLPKLLNEKWKGYSLFEAWTHSPDARAVVLTRNGKFPWKPVSQLEYLNALKKKIQGEYSKIVVSYDDGIEKNRKLIKDLQNQKLSLETKESMIKAAEQQLDKQVQSREANLQKFRTVMVNRLLVIDEYLEKHSLESLQQQAVLNRYKDFIFLREFEHPTQRDASPLVYIDQDYFQKNLPSYEPQFMVLYWRWNRSAPGLYFKKQLEENFPVENLRRMISGTRF